MQASVVSGDVRLMDLPQQCAVLRQYPDGIYGWSHPLSSPGLEATHLDCSHVDCIMNEESVRQIAATLVSLLQSTEGAENTHVANTFRRVEQTSSEQVAVCDAAGSSGHTINPGQ